MGTKQDQFKVVFRERFEREFGPQDEWGGGQVSANKATLPKMSQYRRDDVMRANEGLELGDLRVEIGGSVVIVEYDSGCVSLSNLLKFWPYLRVELSSSSNCRLLFCHFSDWISYGSYRDLWSWLLRRIEADDAVKGRLIAEQFDHGGADQSIREKSLDKAIEFLSHYLR